MKTIAAIVMVCGVLISVILLIFGISLLSDGDGTEIAIMLSITPVLLISTVIWGLLRVLCNISINIKEINGKVNYRQN